MIPEDLRYTAEHEWVRRTGEGTVRVGITDFAQESLGDIVFVQLPDAGTEVKSGESIGEIESTKSVSELFAPLAGSVAARNEQLDSQPELINSDPYGEGWMLELSVTDGAGLDDLLDAAAYQTVTEQA